MQANTAGTLSDEDPDSITSTKNFLIRIAKQFKQNSYLQFAAIFITICGVNFSIIGWVNAAFVGKVEYVPNVTGEVVDNLEIKTRRNVNKERVVARVVVCNLSYPMTPALKLAIHQTMASCAEQQMLAQIAYKESTGGLNLDNPLSSASGPFQFLDSSWSLLCNGNKYSFRAQAECALRLIRSGQANQTWYRWWK